MTTALVIDSSSRHLGSVTRQMTQKFLTQFEALSGENRILHRDLVKSAVPHLSAETIEGFFSPQPSQRAQRATVLSDQLVDEFLSADLICIGTPMYNFNVPSALKAYIDQVIRVGRTFQKVGDGQLQGLCQGKQMLVMYAMGGKYQSTSMDLIKPYFEVLAEFLALDQVSFIAVDGTSRGGFQQEQEMKVTEEGITKFLSSIPSHALKTSEVTEPLEAAL